MEEEGKDEPFILDSAPDKPVPGLQKDHGALILAPGTVAEAHRQEVAGGKLAFQVWGQRYLPAWMAPVTQKRLCTEAVIS